MADRTSDPLAATVERTQNAKGSKSTYDVYEVIEATADQVAHLTGDADDQATWVLVHVGTYEAADAELACWRAAEDADHNPALHKRATSSKPPTLTAGTTGRGGLTAQGKYGLEPTPVFKRRRG